MSKKKSVYQRVRRPWKKSTEKVHDGNKDAKEEKYIRQQLESDIYDHEDYGDVNDGSI